MQGAERSALRIFTIGHSHHPLERFLELLRSRSIEVVVDTRSYPYSNHAPQYDREALKKALQKAGLKYVDMGEQLGGRPKGEEFYDAKGHVLYDRVAASAFFRDRLSRLERGIENHNVALLCSEENPAVCHRKLLIGRVLAERGFAVQHIRGDGRMQSDEELADAAASVSRTGNLFPDAEVSPWKSIPSVLRKRRRSNSLKS